MAKYCANNRSKLLDGVNESENSFNKTFKHDKISTSDIKECFKEYSLDDKIEALKTVLSYNERHGRNIPSHTNNILNIKRTTGVKECLQANQETPFQTLISELRNTIMNSYWNKEVGKTRYQVPNLPVGMNPLETTFGKKTEHKETMAEVLKATINENDVIEQDIIEMYKKSHNSYLPAEQVKRHYKKPFNKNLYYGKPTNVRAKGGRVKKLLTWINTDSHTIVDSEDLNNTSVCTNTIHDKISTQKVEEIRNILNECSLNDEVIKQYNYLQYINSLRLKLKKRIPEIPFADIFEDLLHLDKDYTERLPETKVFSVLTKYKIHINEILLMPLLDHIQIRQGKNINYKALLNLLNWKYDFPTLTKIEKLPRECQYYSTTYNETIGNIKKINTTYTSAAGISSKNVEDKITAYSLIFPNIFTKYGLSRLDLSKPRSKEEIKDIFENIGIQFPNDNFDLIWEEELKKSGKNDLSIEVFKHLFEIWN